MPPSQRLRVSLTSYAYITAIHVPKLSRSKWTHLAFTAKIRPLAPMPSDLNAISLPVHSDLSHEVLRCTLFPKLVFNLKTCITELHNEQTPALRITLLNSGALKRCTLSEAGFLCLHWQAFFLENVSRMFICPALAHSLVMHRPEELICAFAP